MKAGKQGMFGSLKRELGSYIDISKVKTSSIYKILSRKAPCTRKITSLIFLLSLICGSLQVQAQIKGGIIPLVTQPTNPPDMPGPVTGPTPITPGTTTSTYTVTSASGASGYTWTLSNGSAGTITNVGNTATVHWSVSFSGYTIINCTAFNILGSTAANGLAVQVLAAPTASISPVALSTNYNTSPGTISVTNPVDVVNYTYQWQSSPNNSIWTSISGATATSYTPGNLTTTIYFRAVLTNISDLVSYSNSATVTVYPQLVSGNTSPASQSINYNTTPTALTATAATGGNGTCTYQWQSSPNNSTWTNVSGATALAYTPGVLTTTTYYHLVSTSNSASVNSSSATVTVYPLLVSGNISPVLQSINYNTG
ncbi:MAG: hypothetical protein JWP37_978, partial [Mucilaginibacter sp.]|nr:hypothetical protein [Mucilaginibacter sp.]